MPSLSRFTFPPVNLGTPIEPQLTYRAEWVGYKLLRIESDGKGLRWKLSRQVAGGQTEAHVFYSLCEVDMKLAALLERIGDRVEKEQLDRMIAERAIAREIAEQAAAERQRAADQEFCPRCKLSKPICEKLVPPCTAVTETEGP